MRQLSHSWTLYGASSPDYILYEGLIDLSRISTTRANAPLPSMLIAIPFLISTPVNAAPVYERARVVRAWRDNIFVERLWRSIKYEEVYLMGDAP